MFSADLVYRVLDIASDQCLECSNLKEKEKQSIQVFVSEKRDASVLKYRI